MIATLSDFARRHLVADAAPLSPAERWRSALAALLGLLLFQTLLHVLPLPPQARVVMGPLGATSVILFTLPHSPLAQPWSVAGGLLVPALLGYACGLALPHPALAAALALAVSVWVMAWLRCLHPPGGAMALALAAMAAGGAAPADAFAPVLSNAVAILVAVFAVNNIIPHRRYPACVTAATADRQARPAPSGVRHADLQAALEEMDTYLDISEEDLIAVFNHATRGAFRRHLALDCGQVMRPVAQPLEYASELGEAWTALRRGRQAALPVVDRARRVIGLIALEDFLLHLSPAPDRPLGGQLRHFLQATPGSHSDRPEAVGQIMRETRAGLLVARHSDPLDQVALALGEGRQAAVPVVDGEGRLAGMITPPDLSAALFHHLALEHSRREPD